MLSHKKPDSHINMKIEFGEGEGKSALGCDCGAGKEISVETENCI